jgi:capsule biosynthesis phosphatase
MRIGIDLDGVICQLRESGQTYETVKPIPGAIAKLKALRAAGHEIVILTARHMKSTGMNVGKVVARQGLTTLRWLDRHGVEFDEIWFGKPHCDVYLDDNAVRFVSWDEIASDGSNFPEATEKLVEARQK